jgi:nucleoid DNA-binding protein
MTFKADLIKADLVESVSQALNIPFPQTAKMVDRLFYEINHALIKKQSVSINNFGVFKVLKAKPRTARDLYANKIVHIPARYRVKFKMSKRVLEKIRNV